MREYFLPVFTTFVVLGCVAVLVYQYGHLYSEHYLKNQITGVTIGDVGIDVSVADTEAMREQGLSGLSKIGPKEGLLMIFDKADYFAIWMKDMNFPIDIIWIDNNLTIVDITEAISPDTYPSIFEPQAPARMALEVNARFAATYRIKVGDKVQMADAFIPEDLKKK